MVSKISPSRDPPILGGIPAGIALGIMEPPGWDLRWDSVNPMWDPRFVPEGILARITVSWLDDGWIPAGLNGTS